MCPPGRGLTPSRAVHIVYETLKVLNSMHSGWHWRFAMIRDTRGIVIRPVVVLALAAVQVFGQAESGTVVGAVSDQAGSSVAGAAVTVLNTGTGFTRTLTTNDQGQYTAINFPPGQITITVEKSGFNRLVRSGIQLTAAEALTVNLQLQVGDVQQSVEVRATAPLLEAQSAAVSNLVDNRQLAELPINTRQFTALTVLSPGAYVGSSGNLAGAVYGLRASNNFSVNGSQASNNSVLIDGMVNAGLWLNNNVMSPTIDSIQETRNLTSNFSAEYGSAAGMVTVVQTKSGTNAIHGDGYEYLQNADMNANNFFSNRNGLSRVGARRNEFGGTVGGPIKRDRTFFFGDYQGLRIATPITTYNALLPTTAVDQMIQSGNFGSYPSVIYDPTSPAGSPRVAFSNGIIPLNRLDPAAVKLASLLPAPNLSGNASTNYALSPSTIQQTDQFDIRVDQNISNGDRVFAKYSFDNTSLTQPGFLPTPSSLASSLGPYLGNVGYLSPYRNWSITINYIKVIGSVVNEFRAGAVRWNHQILPSTTPFQSANAVGIPGVNINSFSGGLPGMTLSGQNWFLGDTSTFPEQNRELTYQYEDIVSVVKGAHAFKFGGRYLQYVLNGFSSYPTRGNLVFNGQFTSANGSPNNATAFADFALGAYSSVTRNTLAGTFGMRFWNASGFGDDTWRVSNRLTINLGVRYEVQAPPLEVHDRWSNFNVVTGQLLAANQAGNSRRLRSIDTNNVSPRIGMAYTLGRDQKTVFRAGFGQSFSESYNVGQQLYRNAPNFLSYSYTAPLNTAPTQFLSQGLPTLTAPPVSNGVVQIAPGTLPYAWDPNMKTPKVLQWSAGVQRELIPNLSLDVSYVGSRGIDLISNVNYNQAFPSTSSNINSMRPLATIQPNVQQVQYWTNWAGSKYHSFQVKLTKRYSSGLSAGVAYTWSHNLANAQALSQSGDPIQNARCYACEWGNALEDRRHVVAMSNSYELPFGTGRQYLSRGFVGKVVGPWDIDSIWTIQSGSHFGVILSSGVSNTGANVAGTTYDRPNRIGDGNLQSGQTIDRWFDTAAFALPGTGTFGNAGVNVLTGPRFFNMDAGLHRNFLITERWKLQFRAEAFNTLNKANFSTPNGTFGGSTFGKITTTANAARVLQLSLKLYF